MTATLSLALAIAFVATLAWDIARRALALRPIPTTEAERLSQLENNVQQVAIDAAAALNTANAAAETVLQTDKCMQNLAEDWLAKFKQVEAAQLKLDKEVPNKVAATLATAMPARGYNR